MEYLKELQYRLKLAKLNIDVSIANRDLAYAKLHIARIEHDIEHEQAGTLSNVIFDPECLLK